jgi:hypothetical protein
MKRDKRKGFWAGYKKLGPTNKFIIKFTVCVAILGAIYFAIQMKYGASRNLQKEAQKDREEKQEQILASQENISKTLKEVLDKAKNDKEEYLKGEYPLGYIMIAFSGEKKAVLPYTNIFETDWDNIEAYKDDKNIANIEVPYLRDKRTGSMMVGFTIGLFAKEGSKSIKFRFKGSFVAQATCLKADPVGIYLVLGFFEDDK